MSAAKSTIDIRLEIKTALQRMFEQYGFANATTGDYTMGGWWFRMETDQFILTADQHRSGDVLGICVGSKIRRKPRAHMRGPWSLHHLRGYLDGASDHYRFDTPREQLDWLQANIKGLLDTSLLNSDDLNKWAVKASRRMFGQDPK